MRQLSHGIQFVMPQKNIFFILDVSFILYCLINLQKNKCVNFEITLPANHVVYMWSHDLWPV